MSQDDLKNQHAGRTLADELLDGGGLERPGSGVPTKCPKCGSEKFTVRGGLSGTQEFVCRNPKKKCGHRVPIVTLQSPVIEERANIGMLGVRPGPFAGPPPPVIEPNAAPYRRGIPVQRNPDDE